MQRSTRFNRPTLRGSSIESLLFGKQESFVLKAGPDTTTSTSLTWTQPNYKPDNYRIERSLDGTTFSTVTTVANSVVDYIDTGLTESTQYWYRIVPILGGADQPASNVADTWTVPSTPTTLTATAVGGTQIDLTWVDVSTGNTGQIIERRTPSGSGSYSLLATVSATATTYSDTGLTPGQSYEYRVAATNPATLSAYSNTASATPANTVAVDYLVVAGGAGGGGVGGGGAGGYRTATGFSLTTGTSYTITVGAGGAGATAGGNQGSDGSNSVFSTITSTGGGGGGAFSATGSLRDGRSGGSGGGAGSSNVGPNYPAGTKGTGTSGQGNDGGDTVATGGNGFGGGGGASAAGNNGSANVGGGGGAGTSSSITGSSVTRSGGGGGSGNSTRGAGGSGGGGQGAISTLGGNTAGTVNTGGGGGGGYGTTGSAGGSGVVILRYPNTFTATFSAGVTQTQTTSGSDKINTITAAGVSDTVTFN